MSTGTYWPVSEKATAGAKRRQHVLDLVGHAAELAQDRADSFALFDDDEMFAPLGIPGPLRQQRDVLGNDARLEAEIRVGVALGGVIEADARRRAGVSVGQKRRARHRLAG